MNIFKIATKTTLRNIESNGNKAICKIINSIAVIEVSSNYNIQNLSIMSGIRK